MQIKIENTIMLRTCYLLLLCLTPTLGALSTTGCGTSKGCFQDPSGCSPSSASCRFVSWAYMSGAPGGNNYVAMAFTATDTMQNGEGYICSGNNAFVPTSISNTPRVEPTDDGSLPTGVSLTSATVSNGVTECVFTRPASVTKTISGSSVTFNLATTSYRLLVARGTTDDAASGSVAAYHSSTSKSGLTDFTSVAGSSATGPSSLVKAHGALMIIAWVMLAHFGILFAGHFKSTFLGKKVGGEQLWFQVHRTAMIFVFLSTIAGFIIIFVSVNGFVSTQTDSLRHAICGIITTAFVITNPIMAAFRPHPDAKNRWLFNIGHRVVGFGARIAATINLFYGVLLQPMGLERWSLWVLVAFICFHYATEITLGILYCVMYKKGSRSNNIDMANQSGNSPSQCKEEGTLLRIKYAILTVYVIVSLSLTIALLVSIGSA